MKFRIDHFPEVSSTNTLLLEKAAAGEKEGLVITADYQTEGHGKLGRKWVAPAGKNLLFSVLIRPPMAANEAPMLTQIACRSVAAVLNEDFKIETQFKRPNDIMAGAKKICGVLIESATTKDRLDYAVIGIGLNVNARAKDLVPEAASMLELLGRTTDLKPLLKRILIQLKKDLDQFYCHPERREGSKYRDPSSLRSSG